MLDYRENGKVTLDKNRYPFLSLFAYTVKTYSSLIEFEGNILSDHRWKAFSETIRIRHRITHPKLDSELEITDEDLTSIIDGWDWFNNMLRILHDAHKIWLSIPNINFSKILSNKGSEFRTLVKSTFALIPRQSAIKLYSFGVIS